MFLSVVIDLVEILRGVFLGVLGMGMRVVMGLGGLRLYFEVMF